MKFAELEKLLERADRFRKKLRIKNGDGCQWSVTLDDGQTHSYSIKGVRNADEVEDDIATMFIWLWSLKDYVKKYAVENGKGKLWVEAQVNVDAYLCVCADIANSLKHGGLDPKYKSRSSKTPKLGSLNYSIPQKAMGRITTRAFDVELEITEPSFIVLTMPVLDSRDRYIGDALKYLDYGLKKWENIVTKLERAA